VELSGKRVKDLSDQLKSKKEALEKFTKSSKEHKENRRQEIENLKKAKNELKSDKYSMETQLATKGQSIKEAMQKRHEDRMNELNGSLRSLQGELLGVKTENAAAEKLLLTQYDGADKQYTEALESYDTEMREKNKERDDTRADLDDQEYLLSQIRDQWSERVEEKRKREDLQKIMDEKKAMQLKE
jgi:chromosome segregation ATPase